MPSTNDFAAALELVPTGGDVIPADAELDLAVAQLSADTPNPPAPTIIPAFGRGWVFDYQAGRFARYGTAPADAVGIEQLRAWIEKTARTYRFAHDIYSDDYGVDDVDIIGSQLDTAALSDYAGALTDALLIHDRISSVEDFTFDLPDPSGDYIVASFTVVTDSDALVISIPVGGA